MKILIENYKYPQIELSKLLPPKLLTLQGQSASVEWVGYYNNFGDNESVIILPKIFEKGNKIFESIDIHSLLSENTIDTLKSHQKSKHEIDFIHRFALIFYLSLKEFQHRKENTSEITQKEALKSIISNLEGAEISELDLVFSLLRFHQENKDLIIFKQKQNESAHFKKTNWAKTIRSSLPILQNGKPIYLQTIQKQKAINQEDELITIFYNLLFRFKNEYGFNITFELGFEKMPATGFEKKTLKTLKNIRNQYFTDKFKKLLTLLILYFEKRTSANARKGGEEFILCKDYNIVFEDMIDKLISDEYIPKDLKAQKDGKIVDHIFQYSSLFQPDSIFYIGDAKYYKDTTPYSANSIYKQHTYAKNIIQYNINLFHQKTEIQKIRYRDELTEGYNISPNFFIQGFINHSNLMDKNDQFKPDHEQVPKINFQFENRVFDRDSLVVLSFKINFLFVLDAYITKDKTLLQQFRNKAVTEIKKFVIHYFQESYDFYVLTPKISIQDFVNKHFKILNGKIYKSSGMENTLILGLLKNSKYSTENEDIKQGICTECEINDFNIS